MPDISMCDNSQCPLAKKCYRSTQSGTKPSEFRQSFSSFKYDAESGCGYYWERSNV